MKEYVAVVSHLLDRRKPSREESVAIDDLMLECFHGLYSHKMQTKSVSCASPAKLYFISCPKKQLPSLRSHGLMILGYFEKSKFMISVEVCKTT